MCMRVGCTRTEQVGELMSHLDMTVIAKETKEISFNPEGHPGVGVRGTH